MPRAAYQVLVFPFFINDDETIDYALFRRKDADYWQGIAGGGETGEAVLESAKRETYEESGIAPESKFIVLDSVASVPVTAFADHALWGKDTLVIPEYSFGVAASDKNLSLSAEHTEYIWMDYENAVTMLKWDSNKTCLWELHQRLSCGNS
ncbi:NUDIX pyrophosphatase [Planctomycetota bacterium]